MASFRLNVIKLKSAPFRCDMIGTGLALRVAVIWLPWSFLKARKVNGFMKVTVNRIKRVAIAITALPLLTVILLNSTSVKTSAADEAQDVAAVYKAKCAACHSPKAEKAFDPTKTEEQLTEAILKGVKPKMPGYETKGISAEQAKALVDYMKQLRQQ